MKSFKNPNKNSVDVLNKVDNLIETLGTKGVITSVEKQKLKDGKKI